MFIWIHSLHMCHYHLNTVGRLINTLSVAVTVNVKQKKTKLHTVMAVSPFKSDFKNLIFLSDPAVNNLQQRHIKRMTIM